MTATRTRGITKIRVAIFIAACLGVFALAFILISMMALGLERRSAPTHVMNELYAEIDSTTADTGGMRISRSLKGSILERTSLYYIPTGEATTFMDQVKSHTNKHIGLEIIQDPAAGSLVKIELSMTEERAGRLKKEYEIPGRNRAAYLILSAIAAAMATIAAAIVALKIIAALGESKEDQRVHTNT